MATKIGVNEMKNTKKIRRLVRQRTKLIDNRNEVNDKITELNNEIIQLMEKDDVKSVRVSKEDQINIQQNTYDNYDFNYLNRLFTKKLTKTEKDKVIETKVSYALNEQELIKVVKNGKITLKQLRKGVSESYSKPFLRMGRYKKND